MNKFGYMIGIIILFAIVGSAFYLGQSTDGMVVVNVTQPAGGTFSESGIVQLNGFNFRIDATDRHTVLWVYTVGVDGEYNCPLDVGVYDAGHEYWNIPMGVYNVHVNVSEVIFIADAPMMLKLYF